MAPQVLEKAESTPEVAGRSQPPTLQDETILASCGVAVAAEWRRKCLKKLKSAPEVARRSQPLTLQDETILASCGVAVAAEWRRKCLKKLNPRRK